MQRLQKARHARLVDRKVKRPQVLVCPSPPTERERLSGLIRFIAAQERGIVAAFPCVAWDGACNEVATDLAAASPSSSLSFAQSDKESGDFFFSGPVFRPLLQHGPSIFTFFRVFSCSWWVFPFLTRHVLSSLAASITC
ncbi:hypothetical protein MPH_02279 [Macrophomina phaseolina MS6]|uniref:Uncharacterized protein n=1 Tax=Macrophomina phaseolina (strain MS6) TaxID=1126212 RepID=K2SD81_MACPH|nr:hypothetical protein MPH_02279 [Macrophomina phaseolina MS6]